MGVSVLNGLNSISHVTETMLIKCFLHSKLTWYTAQAKFAQKFKCGKKIKLLTSIYDITWSRESHTTVTEFTLKEMSFFNSISIEFHTKYFTKDSCISLNLNTNTNKILDENLRI